MQLNKNFLLIISLCSLLLLFCNLPVHTQAVNSNTTQPDNPVAENPGSSVHGARIVFDNKILDFGKIGTETRPSGEFKFTNTGNAVLEITQVSQCCGIVITYEKSKYQPGENGLLKVLCTATAQTGKISRIPIVYSNDPVEPNLALMITAEIVNKVIAQPDRLKLFLDEDNTKVHKITISSTDKQPFTIKDIKSTGNCITAAYESNLKATEFEIDFKVDMVKLQQNMRGNVDISITHPEMSLLTIPFDVLSRFTFEPLMILVLNAEPGKPEVRKIWVFNNYNQEFEIESISSKNNYITVLSEGKVNDGYQFEVQITPPPGGDKRSFSDELYILIKDREKLKIDCNGYYTPPKTTGSSK
ncbi:MAG: DUF1573 domain-containing protein [Sedimentisphaerales bacterium]|nr:DUF1573 domain-containing protein [Sedimentisphaerales bacterium]